MERIEYHFLPGIRAQTDVQYQMAGKSGVWNDLHLAQSHIDSACGLLSVCTAAMLLLGLPRSRFEKLTLATRGPLGELWRRASQHVFEGTDHRDLAGYVAAFPDLSCETLLSTSAARIGAAAAEAIRAGHVPVLRFDARTWSHFSTVVGVERVAGEPLPRALLLLDPSHPAPWIVPFNARCELTRPSRPTNKSRRPYVLPVRYLGGEAWSVQLRSLLIVRAQAP